MSQCVKSTCCLAEEGFNYRWWWLFLLITIISVIFLTVEYLFISIPRAPPACVQLWGS